MVFLHTMASITGDNLEPTVRNDGHSAIRSDELPTLNWIGVSPHKLAKQTQLLDDLKILQQHLLSICPIMKTEKTKTQERVYTRIFETQSKNWTEIGYKHANRSLFHDSKWYNLLQALCDSHDEVIEMRYKGGVALRSHSTQMLMRKFMSSLSSLENEPKLLLQKTKWVLPVYKAQADSLLQSWMELEGMMNEVLVHFQGDWD